MLKLKLHYFGHVMPRVDSLEKTLMLRHVYPNVHRSTVYNSQDMEAT